MSLDYTCTIILIIVIFLCKIQYHDPTNVILGKSLTIPNAFGKD
ncbi:hypothetical protein SAMN04487995_0898 [Dyadobacter koreensis]|uniref:Uncharacterized protein n=1 Tax=Dyadobacter koreensis TaxID=408657 RepID=A0A1H6R3T9_9BACT|nr:hypothetical protein SAMN04487995_0898 [Dyadobacter koreensis]